MVLCEAAMKCMPVKVSQKRRERLDTSKTLALVKEVAIMRLNTAAQSAIFHPLAMEICHA